MKNPVYDLDDILTDVIAAIRDAEDPKNAAMATGLREYALAMANKARAMVRGAHSLGWLTAWENEGRKAS